MTANDSTEVLRVALAQLNLCVGDLSGNVGAMVAAW